MSDQFNLTLLNRATEIARAQDRLEQLATSHQFPDRKLHDVQIALEEHLTNILHYGYDDQGDHEIQVAVSFAAGELRIQVKDDGRSFNPLAHPAPDLALPLAERPIGGLGIHMIRKALDHVEYRRESGNNILVMIKHI